VREGVPPMGRYGYFLELHIIVDQKGKKLIAQDWKIEMDYK